MKKIGPKLWNFMGFRSTTVVLIGIGLFIRILALIALARFSLASDAASYHNMALQLLNQESFAPYWPPGLPYFLSFFYFLLGPSEILGRASMLLYYLFFSSTIFGLAKEISSTRSANLAVLIFTLYPNYIFHSVETYTQLPTAAYLLAAAYLVVLINKKFHWVHPILLGIITGLLILTRASSSFLVGLVILYLILKIKKGWYVLVPLCVSLLIVSSWVGKVHQMTGRWIMVNEANAYNFFVGNNPYTLLYKTWWFGSHGADDPEVPAAYTEMLSNIRSHPPQIRNRLFQDTALDHIKSRPDLFLLRTANRIRNYFAFESITGSVLIRSYSLNKVFCLAVIFFDALFYCAVMLLAIRGLFEASIVKQHLENIVLLLTFTLGYAVPYWISFSHPVYHFPVVPFFAILASIFMEGMITPRAKAFSWVPSGSRKYPFFVACLIFGLIQVEWVLVMWSRI